MQSAILLAHRYADIAAEQAQSASPLRRRELALMERNLRRVPEFGARGLMLAYAGGRPNSSDAESVCRYVISSEIEMLNDTLAMMDFNVMEKVAELLCRARQVIFAGEGRSYLAAKSAVTRFSGIGILCSCHVYRRRLRLR